MKGDDAAFFSSSFLCLDVSRLLFLCCFLYFAKVLGVAIVGLADAQEESPQGISDK